MITVLHFGATRYTCSCLMSRPPCRGVHSLPRLKQLFEKAPSPSNSSSWVAAMKGASSPLEALGFYAHMHRQGVLPNSFLCLLVLKYCTALSHPYMILHFHAHFLKIALHGHLYVGTALVNAYASCNRIADAQKMFDEMSARNTVTWNTLITGYSKCGDIETAWLVFDAVPERNVESWSAIISGHMRVSRWAQGLELFREMQLAGVKPDKVALINVLSACAQVGSMGLGMWIHAYIQKNGFELRVELGTALVDMYAKCGFIDGAQQVFGLMPEKNIMTWSAMISGLAMHGCGKEALDLFQEMQAAGVRPNGFTLTGVLSACSHAGLVGEGKKFFHNMTKQYGVIPRIEHYGCLVDLLSRSGLLDEAYDLVKSMRMKPNIVVWGALLGGCKIHKQIQLGEHIIEHILQQQLVNPEDNGGVYALICNMYAAFGNWKDAERMRHMIKIKQVKRTPGSSLIEVGDMVHEFVVADKLHPQRQEILEMLGEIFQQLEAIGYRANTSPVFYDIEEEEKECAIRYHSEKLAIAFALMSLCSDVSVRIVKNLRICDDCHNFAKSVSEVYGREIIIRDKARFHHFKQGSCSCMDYW
ncbi:pentatricopeptide repeat-containing protein At3g62890-like [Nymphaea colorata]|uniref:DYW domain-containing protein n=1 Tax=Nymphaea colorata TaxID=210225 RepID=A0A5K0Y949_9MAGN|nr:pentatricopeptide repeat-containing protein At3g62890-like [Nymphaea colorata]VVV74110.1 unnamed protein product [Nymphaea colorata]